MNWYPQIASGAMTQLPVTRSRKWRAIANTLEDGEQIMLPDTSAGQIEWKLSYRDLSSAEAQSLSALFTVSQGGYGPFTFVDPLANLLSWSESFSQSSWQSGLLQVTSGAGDPLGTQRASTVSNPNPGGQSLQQTLAISGSYVTCFSAYLRSGAPAAVTLQRDSAQTIVPVGPSWTRAYLSGAGISGAAQSTFSLMLAAGQAIDIWGVQVETQPYPSAYKETTAAIGIYEQTYFKIDELTMIGTSPGLSSCEITLVSQV